MSAKKGKEKLIDARLREITRLRDVKDDPHRLRLNVSKPGDFKKKETAWRKSHRVALKKRAKAWKSTQPSALKAFATAERKKCNAKIKNKQTKLTAKGNAAREKADKALADLNAKSDQLDKELEARRKSIINDRMKSINVEVARLRAGKTAKPKRVSRPRASTKKGKELVVYSPK